MVARNVGYYGNRTDTNVNRVWRVRKKENRFIRFFK